MDNKIIAELMVTCIGSLGMPQDSLIFERIGAESTYVSENAFVISKEHRMLEPLKFTLHYELRGSNIGVLSGLTAGIIKKLEDYFFIVLEYKVTKKNVEV